MPKPLALAVFTAAVMLIALLAISVVHHHNPKPEPPPPPRFSASKTFPDGSSVTAVLLTTEDSLFVWRKPDGTIDYTEVRPLRKVAP